MPEMNAGDLAALLKQNGYDASGMGNPAEENLAKLPKAVKDRVRALKGVQMKSVEIEAKFYERVHQIEKEFEAEFNKVYEERRKIVNGEYQPTEAEINAHQIIHGADAEALAELDKDAPADNGEVGVPEFWLTVLKNADSIGDMITENDEPILKHLTDITTSVEMSPPGFTLYFHFSPNEFFDDAVLVKKYELQLGVDAEEPFEYDGPTISKAVGQAIKWKDGKDVTKRVVKKKQKKGPNAGKMITKTIKAESFFNFFDPPTVPEDQNEDDEEGAEAYEMLQADYEMGQVIRDHIIPRATLFFTGEAGGDDPEFDDMDEGDEEEDEDEDDE